MNEGNNWDQIADAVERPNERVMREEIMEEFKHLMIGMATGSSDVYTDMILAS